eukprot:g1750.t1
MVLEMEVLYSYGGSARSRLQRSDDIMINPAARLPNEGRLKRKNGEILPELRNDVGTRSIHNGSHQRERQLWLRARARCMADGDGRVDIDCMDKATGDGSATEAVDASAGATTMGTAAGSETAAPPQSRRVVADSDRKLAENRVGSGGGDLSGNTPAGAGRTRSLTAGDARGSPPSSSDASTVPASLPRRGQGGEFVSVPAPAGGAEEKWKRRPRPGIERNVISVGVDVEVPTETREGGRLLGGAGSAGVRGQGTIDGAEGKTAEVDQAAGGDAAEMPLEERLARLEAGIALWGNTYVPPIAPDEKQRLIDRWSASAEDARKNGTAPGDLPVGAQRSAPRILFVITSFDRGRRLRTMKDVDKLDYVLMIMDEIREACEAGFSPQVHLISAWDAQQELGLLHDRLFCRRIGGLVPLSLEQHPPSIREVLSIKHRVYMKPRVKDFDLFLQLEDDMILTVNHILLYLQESEKLSVRIKGTRPKYDLVPGFVRVEPEPGVKGVGGEWYEWEIILSRFRGVHVVGAGTYLTLEKSRVLPYAGNNQGFWMATQEQLKYLQRQCQYLRYTDQSSLPFVEKFSGSLEQFSPVCHTTKVFPATHLEDFMVHHRTNNKNGKRGESTPAVSTSMLRLWAAQTVRDDEMLMEVGNTGRR